MQPSLSAQGGDLLFAQVDVPLLAIPAFDGIAVLFNRHLKYNWGICSR
jgi:hypothetical protein